MPRSRRVSAILFLTLPVLASLPAHAQAPATGGPGTGTTGGAAPGGGAPGANTPTPGVAGGVPNAPLPPGKPLTLAEVVNTAVGGNSGLVLARQRLQKAQELIVQVTAQGRPQFRADAADTYTTYNTFAPTIPNPTVTNPTLPGGGQIPVVVDNGNGFSTSYLGGGGGGNAPTSGASLPTTGLTAGPSVGGPAASPTGTTGIGNVGGTGTVGAPVGTSPTGTAPSTAAPASPGAPASPVSPAPPVGPASPSAPAAPAAPAGAAGPSVGASLPSLVAGYITDISPTPEAAPRRVAEAETTEAPARQAHADDTGTGGTTGTGGNSGGTTNPVTGTGGGGSGVVTGQRNNYAARVSASQLIDLFGLLPAAKSAQQDVRDFYSLDIERLGNETALAAKNLFFNVLLNEAQVTTQAEQVRYAEENVRITEARLRQGIVSRFDVLTAQTALSTAQQQLIAAQNGRDLAQADLAYLLGTDPDQPITLQAPPLPPLDQAVDLRGSTQMALARRPEVKQADANVREARRLVKLAGSPLLPTLGIVASGVSSGTDSPTVPRSYGTLSAQLAVPLDDGGATRSRVRSAKTDVDTQTLTLEQIRLNVALEVRQATLNVRNAQAQVGAAQTGVTQAQEALRLVYLRYEDGLGTFLDVLNALAQLARTRTNLENAQYFYQTSLAQLVRAMGGR